MHTTPNRPTLRKRRWRAFRAILMNGWWTRVLMFEGFKESDARFRNYYQSDPARPFCRTYIDPKLALLRERFGEKVAAQVPQNV